MMAKYPKLVLALGASVALIACGDPTIPSPSAGDPNPSPRLSDRLDAGTSTTPPNPIPPAPAVEDAGSVVDAGSTTPAVDAGPTPNPNPNPNPTPVGCSTAPQTPDPAWSHGCPAYAPTIRPAGSDAAYLIGKFAYCELIDKDLKEEWVQTWVEDTQCNWTMVSRQKTSLDNDSVWVDGVQDDGGRIFKLLAGAAVTAGSHNVTMLVEGDLSRADFALHVFKRGTHAVIFDIDATLTTSDLQAVMSLAADIFGGSFSPTAYDGAAELTRNFAAKGYKVIYLTARKEFMRSLTEKWLKDGGFAAGVVFFMDGFSLSPPSKPDQLAYKKAKMKEIATTKGLAIDYAYGNAEHDVEAYQSVGIPNSRIFTIGDIAGVRSSTPIRDNYCDHLNSARGFPTPSQP
ncbi:MAG: hypothetical protein HYY84_09450 [Deltaproteobacteria bacterium]|nr:hypothetical protein [Deltaproteobacteria bacterium]